MDCGPCFAFDKQIARGYGCDRVQFGTIPIFWLWIVANNVDYAPVMTYLINAFSVTDTYRVTSWW